MKRRLFNLLTSLSLLLCVAVCVLWARSYWCFDQLARQRLDAGGRPRGIQVHSYRGVIAFHALLLDRSFAGAERLADGFHHNRLRGGPGSGAYDPTTTTVRAGFGSGGFRYRIGTGPPGSAGAQIIWGTARVWVVPYYALALATAALPAAGAWGRWKRRRAHPPGSCPTCGYDLRATPQRCPECGSEQPPPRERQTRSQGTGCERARRAP